MPNLDEDINLEYDFSFDKEIEFSKDYQRIFVLKAIVEEDYFIHIEDIFVIEDKR